MTLDLRPLDVEPCLNRRLPARRQSVRTQRVYRDPFSDSEVKLFVTVGIDPADDRVAELFIRSGGKAGKNSMLERMLDDGGVLLSKLLQRGMTLEDLAQALGYSERSTSLGSASPLAEAVAMAIELQRDVDSWPPGAARA